MDKNVRQNKLLSKLQNMSFFKKNILFIAICFILLTCSTIGYAALNQKLFISGDLALRAVKDIRISDLKLLNTTSGGYELYNSKYTTDSITISAALPENGDAVTYQATITNYGTADMEIASISSCNENWFTECTISGIKKDDEIAGGATKKFEITLKNITSVPTTDYMSSALIELKFQEAKTRYLAYNIKGNSTQDGTPTPDSPAEIQSVGEKTKNLFPITNDNIEVTYGNVTLSINNGIITLNGTATSNFQFGLYLENGKIKSKSGIIDTENNTPSILNLKNGTYTQSLKYISGTISSESGSYYAGFYTYKNATKLLDTRQAMGNKDVSKTFTISNNNDVQFFVIQVVAAKSPVIFNDYKFKYQLEEGSAATEYEPYGYKIPIQASGKNLFDINSVSGSVIANGTAEKITNGWTVKGNLGNTSQNSSYANGWFSTGNAAAKFYLEAGTQVTISADVKIIKLSDTLTDNNKMNIYLYGAENHTTNTSNTLNNNGITRVTQTYTVNTSGNYYPVFTVQNNELEITNIQIEKGASATDYEPYIEAKTYNIYLDEPLRKIGEYADYIDYSNKKIVRHIKETTINSLSFGAYSSVNNYYRYETSKIQDKLFTETLSMNLLSNVLQVVNYNQYADNSIAERNTLNYLRILSTKYSTLEELNNAIGDEKVYYVLSSPLEQSTDLPEIISSPLYTNYEVLTSIAPSDFTYEIKVKN